MFESPELTLCNKTERVTVFKIPPLSTTKGHYLDDWKQMIWEGGVKVTEKNKEITITFKDKNQKVFAQLKIGPDQTHTQCIAKTLDSSRGYAIRLSKPNGGYLWIGVAFRDRNDAFDFGVAFQDFAQRKKLENDPGTLDKQFQQKMDFGVKKGEKIRVNLGKKQKSDNNNADFFSDFKPPGFEKSEKQAPKQKKIDEDWFGGFDTKKQQPKKKKNSEYNLLDL